jgi:two-component system, NarL family, response regulator DegU
MTQSPDTPNSIPGRGLIRVILADDHPLGRQGLRYYLEDSGRIEVVAETGDGEEAIRLITDLRPDVGVLDMAMPRANGIEVTRQVVERKLATRLLILSAYGDVHLVRNALETGVTGYLLKNASPDLIVEAVEAVHTGEIVLDKAFLSMLEPGTSAVGTDFGPGVSLSMRERQVLLRISNGGTDRAIGQDLGISETTVANHLARIFKKLHVNSRTQAAVKGIALGLIPIRDSDSREPPYNS